MATDEILQAIPHRPPFLFVDEVVEQSVDSLTAKKHVDASEAFFEGHYPGNPIMPGVLISEAVFQTGAIFLTRLLSEELESDSDMVPVLTKIVDARFRSIVRPGDDLYITVKLKEKAGRFIFMTGGVKNGEGKRVMNVTFSVALAKAEQNE
ncbi:MAG TPA: beta-hydroxyacyl-ACP dehydratase [Opitutae bacterium]|nr:beta-hydroxyacyl-ACP dehydratase [Opitutae bacterium]|tara:strand:- start:1902 stop:2354 length:453 start_codon:yes stop_codon:yes gene_type:complete